jgi:DNA-binding transcriptional LysR family regulator
MDNWDEIRTASYVAKLGTLSAAASALGLHRATVTRHVDALEEALGAKLFLRHARGFTPTELGRDLLRVANATNDQFSQLQRRARGQSGDLEGQLVITAIDILIEDILQALAVFKAEHPRVTVRIISSESILRLEYGEAHIALRAGVRPADPDNVVLPFRKLRMGLYATRDYVSRHGRPEDEHDFAGHRFVGPASMTPRAAFLAWMIRNVPAEAITVRSDQAQILRDAIFSGLGIGFLHLPLTQARDDLVEILKPRADWVVGSWIVTHVDLHRTPKVQAFLKALKGIKSR